MADNGHVLSSGGLRLDGTDHLWVPTTWVVLPDEVQPVHGATRCGIVSLLFAAGTPARAEFIALADISRKPFCIRIFLCLP